MFSYNFLVSKNLKTGATKESVHHSFGLTIGLLRFGNTARRLARTDVIFSEAGRCFQA
jgi:hypothetical protein